MRFSLKDILDVAVSTASLIIATTIFLSMLASKFTAFFERDPTLTEEIRRKSPSEAGPATSRTGSTSPAASVTSPGGAPAC